MTTMNTPTIEHPFPTAGTGAQVTVTCEQCGCRHVLARRLREPETITLMCPVCEEIVWARFTRQHIRPKQ